MTDVWVLLCSPGYPCVGRSWSRKGDGARRKRSGVWVWNVMVSMKNSKGVGEGQKPQRITLKSVGPPRDTGPPRGSVTSLAKPLCLSPVSSSPPSGGQWVASNAGKSFEGEKNTYRWRERVTCVDFLFSEAGRGLREATGKPEVNHTERGEWKQGPRVSKSPGPRAQWEDFASDEVFKKGFFRYPHFGTFSSEAKAMPGHPAWALGSAGWI